MYIRRVNQRNQRLQSQLGVFLQEYAKKAQSSGDPNDRRYNRKVEALIKRMKPEQFDELLNASDGETPEPPDLRPE